MAVDLWTGRLDQPEVWATFLGSLCSPDEQTRAARLVDPKRARAWLVGRGILRTILATYTGSAAAAIQIITQPGGKPQLAGTDARVRFSVSHSGAVIAVAVAHDREVGVDLEWIDRQLDVDAVARRFLARSELSLLQASIGVERTDIFFRLWTAKEACLKAAGLGLAAGLDAVDVVPDRRAVRAVARHPDGGTSTWSLSDFSPPHGYIGTLAVAGAPAIVRRRHWPEQ
jgi:4'-phosphopantetheinyl transferase